MAQRTAMSEALTDSEKMAERHVEQQETASVSNCECFFDEVKEQNEWQEKRRFFNRH